MIPDAYRYHAWSTQLRHNQLPMPRNHYLLLSVFLTWAFESTNLATYWSHHTLLEHLPIFILHHFYPFYLILTLKVRLHTLYFFHFRYY
ncbi:hypothetical protein BDZ91DRAFT_725260 [Kalaharituber pfeilii]|nr:hypothetical protein BDZ91DRAFT_725260 [Kalaharituber pfeilii]